MIIHPAIEEAIKKCTLVFFVGAGFSRGLGLPTWPGLVETISRELGREYPNDHSITEVASNFKKNKLTELEALDILNIKYRDTVLQILGRTLDIEFTDKNLEGHRKLWQITDQIVTTNYDRALDQVAPEAVELVVNEDDSAIARLSESEHFLFKVHGCVTNPRSCVLFTDQYKQIYNGKEGVTLELFRILTDKTIIFLGFSLNDPFVNELLQLRQTAYKGLKQNNFIITKGIADLSALGIERITAVNNYGRDMKEFLDALIRIRKRYPYGFGMLMRGLTKEGKTFDIDGLRKDYDDLVEQIEKDPSNAEIAKEINAGDFNTAEKKLKEKLQYNLDSVNEKIAEAACSAFELAKLKKVQLKYYEAADFYRQAVHLLPANLLYRNELAVMLQELGEFDEADEHYRIVLEAAIKDVKKNPYDMALGLHNQALSLVDRGRLREALQQFKMALTLAESDFDNNHVLIATINGAMGGVYIEMGEYDKARPLLEKAISVELLSFSDETHQRVGSYVHTAGQMHYYKGEYEDALKCFENALGMFTPKYGEEHPWIAIIYSSIGNVYLKMDGKIAKGIEYFQRALKVNEKVFKHDHPSIASNYSHLGMAFAEMGDFEQALDHFEEGLQICQNVYEEDHPDIGLAFNNIGGVLMHLDAYDEALEYFELSYEMGQEMLGPDHTITRSAAAGIVKCRKILEL